MPFEENDVSINAFGGTELAKRQLASLLDKDLVDNFQIIPSRIRDLDYSKIRILWLHDLPQDPESAKLKDINLRNKFHKFVFVSNWQYSQYQTVLGFPYNEQCTVIETGITPAPENVFSLKPKDKIRIVYTSTPQRGLELLVPAFEYLAKIYPEIHLDVFSSFKIYGWEDADKGYEPLYDKIRQHPQMTYHGFVPNQQILDQLNKSHIFAYPSIWLETSCRAMLEAMSAGLICVHPNYGALSDTSGNLNIIYQGNMEDKSRHASVFASSLNAAINIVKENREESIVKFNKIFVDSRYAIDRITNQWNLMLNSLLSQYPTVESRNKQKELFVYKSN